MKIYNKLLLFFFLMMVMAVSVQSTTLITKTIYPVSDATPNQWFSTGCNAGSHYDCINDESLNLNDYVYTDSWGKSDLYNFENTNLASNTYINNVKLHYIAQSYSYGQNKFRTLLNLDETNYYGSIYNGGYFSLVSDWASYQQEYTMNPVASSPWTAASVDSLQAGMDTEYGDVNSGAKITSFTMSYQYPATLFPNHYGHENLSCSSDCNLAEPKPDQWETVGCTNGPQTDFLCVDEVGLNPDTSDYLQEYVGDQLAIVNLNSLNEIGLNQPSSINMITLRYYAKRYDSTHDRFTPVLAIDNSGQGQVLYYGTTELLTNTWVWWTQDFYTNPATGQPWTVQELDTLGVGMITPVGRGGAKIAALQAIVDYN